MIEVKNLVKQYGNIKAVDNLSFTVEDGQIYGFLGPNGAGKSTTMNIMTGYLGATAGEVLINGISISEEPEKAKSQIGYLPEIPPLYVDMTVDEYLRFVAGLNHVPKAEIKRQLDEIKEMAQITHVQHRPIRNLSKGYRQRVGVAQALVGFPEYLIFDEPTVGLDPKQTMEMRNLIRSLSKNHTIILSSHVLSEVQEICNKILIIYHGKTVASGTPAELEYQLVGASGLELITRGDPAELTRVLSAVDGVSKVTMLSEQEPGTVALHISRASDDDIREKIYRACAAADFPILTMRSTGMKLEDIFLRLTGDAADAEALTEQAAAAVNESKKGDDAAC